VISLIRLVSNWAFASTGAKTTVRMLEAMARRVVLRFM
jgi:hypothetical protein